MRRIVIGLMSTLSGLVLLFSYHTSTNSGTSLASGTTGSGSTGSGSSGSGSSGSGSTGSGSTGSGSTGSSKASSGSGSGSTANGTFTGDAVMTRWGVVQVEITVKNGKIVKSRAVQYPNGNGRDVEINDYALPILDQEAVQASSANIDAIGGATVTSDGYIQSLQSAVDQAHL